MEGSAGGLHDQTDLEPHAGGTRAAWSTRRVHAEPRSVQGGLAIAEADTLTRLGDTHHAAGGLHSARDAWQHAATILDQLDHPDAGQVRAKLGGLTLPTSERADE